MTESGESLSNSKKYCSVLEKISKINDVKQNEKHPFIFKKICGRYGIQTHFKGGRTIKTFWSPPRTKTLWSTKVVPSIGTNVRT